MRRLCPLKTLHCNHVQDHIGCVPDFGIYIHIYVCIISIQIIHTCIVNTNATPSSTIFPNPFRCATQVSDSDSSDSESESEDRSYSSDRETQELTHQGFPTGDLETWTEGRKELK